MHDNNAILLAKLTKQQKNRNVFINKIYTQVSSFTAIKWKVLMLTLDALFWIYSCRMEPAFSRFDAGSQESSSAPKFFHLIRYSIWPRFFRSFRTSPTWKIKVTLEILCHEMTSKVHIFWWAIHFCQSPTQSIYLWISV